MRTQTDRTDRERLASAMATDLDTVSLEELEAASSVYDRIARSHKGYCAACQTKGHDTCSLTPGCPCCEQTSLALNGEGT